MSLQCKNHCGNSESDADNSCMAKYDTMILSSGGLRSLVATALITSELEPELLVVLHYQKRQANARKLGGFVEEQAEHFQIAQVVRSEMASLIPSSGQSVRDDNAPEPVTFHQAQMLIAGMAQAIEFGVKRLVVPWQCNAVYEKVARLTEQITLVSHIAELEYDKLLPEIHVPILDLTDRQLIELGGQMQLPWHKSWSCRHAGDEPCGGCPACVRRAQAFKEAGIHDTPRK